MSSFINKLKGKGAGGRRNEQRSEPTFSIQPHPAKTNNPSDLQPPQPGGGLNNKAERDAMFAPGPVIPSQEVKNNLPQPASRDELRARSAQLNANQ